MFLLDIELQVHTVMTANAVIGLAYCLLGAVLVAADNFTIEWGMGRFTCLSFFITLFN